MKYKYTWLDPYYTLFEAKHEAQHYGHGGKEVFKTVRTDLGLRNIIDYIQTDDKSEILFKISFSKNGLCSKNFLGKEWEPAVNVFYNSIFK